MRGCAMHWNNSLRPLRLRNGHQRSHGKREPHFAVDEVGGQPLSDASVQLDSTPSTQR